MAKVSLHRFANLPQRFLLALGLGIGVLVAGAIAPPPSMPEQKATANAANKAASVAVYFDALSTAPLTAEAFLQIAPLQLPEFMPVTLYTPTPSCETYATTQAAIAQKEAIPQIVQFLLATQVPQLIDFELAGYRVFRGTQGNTVTIDFRRRPRADRLFISLSICERRILFGSLRETLLQNPALGIDAVHFTEQGEPIYL